MATASIGKSPKLLLFFLGISGTKAEQIVTKNIFFFLRFSNCRVVILPFNFGHKTCKTVALKQNMDCVHCFGVLVKLPEGF
jgi:hypothetical protein